MSRAVPEKNKGRLSAMPSTAATNKRGGGGRSTSHSLRESRAASRATAGGNHMATINEKGTVVGDLDSKCQICSLRGKNRPALFYCTTCNMPLCQFCNHQHKATKVTAEHAIIQKRDKNINEQVCLLHRFAAVQYFCDDCCKFVCVNCTMLEHRGHKVMEIKEKVEECKVSMQKAVSSLDAKITVVNQELRKVQDAEKEIEACREKVKDEINEKVMALLQKIATNQAALLQEVDTYMDAKLDFIVRRKELMQNKFEEMMSVRMANDLNRVEMKDEKFITDTLDAYAKLTKWKDEQPLDETELKKLKLIFGNKGDLGRVETTDEPLFRYKTLTVQKLPPPANSMNPLFHHNDGGSTSRNSKLLPALDLYTGDDYSPRTNILRKDYQTVKIMSKFKTISYVQKPSGIAVLPNGRFIIADAQAHGVVIADKTGRFQQKMFQDDAPCPQGVAVDKKGHIYVSTDKYVKKFKVGGTKLGQFTAYPTPGPIKVDSQGRILVCDVKARHLTIYDEDGRAITKFYVTDKTGNGPDVFNMAVSGDHIALSYQNFGISYFVRVYNYEGQLMFSAKIPERCLGIEMDTFGNMVVASGELVYLANGGQNILPLTTLDKSGRLFTLNANRVAFTQNGFICTIHVNPIARRSEFVVLQMGRNVAASS